MWLFRGAQSAVFYYAACTPCAASLHQRRRKKDAAKTHREAPPADSTLVTDQPHLFQQPIPFTTNSYWAEEIALGPGPPARRAGRRNNASRTGTQRNMASPDIAPSLPQPTIAEAMTGVLEDLVPSRKDKDPLRNQIGDRWNRMRYQREDEVLWGGEVKGSSVGLSGRGRANTAGSAKYYVARNPEVNDLHPPIVCGPTSRAETRWMIQPPPSAKVMAGKVRSTTLSMRDSPHASRERLAGRRYIAGPSTIPDDQEGEDNVQDVEDQTTQKPKQSEAQLDGCPTQPAPRKRRIKKPPPIAIVDDSFFALSPASSNDVVHVPPRVVLAPLASSDPPLSYHPLPLSKDHLHLNPSASLNSRPASPSPTRSLIDLPRTTKNHDTKPSPQWQWPWRSSEESSGDSRPASNATADSGKAFPAQKPHSTWPDDIEMKEGMHNVRSIHLEVSQPGFDVRHDEDEDINVTERYHTVRPFRWSMDI
ncbi:hypothetical protein FQN53_001884 [Emmonsiellopsis sp. PD_33]|nr:hypothetical protein FQN53_001884 [Emmonsiellopsis sp. PD_33]